MNKQSIPNKVIIQKHEPPGCKICSSKNVTFTVSYIDTANRIEHRGHFYANTLEWSCPDHVAAVTAIVLEKNNLIPKDPLAEVAAAALDPDMSYAVMKGF